MAWNALGTTMAMIGFLGVVGGAGYVISSTDPVERSERLCKPIRDVRDLSYKYMGLLHSDVESSTKLYPRGIDYLHNEVCVKYGASYFFGKEAAEIYRHKDMFSERLKRLGTLSKDEVSLILMTGEDSGIDWRSELETNSLLNEYMVYRSHRES